MAIKRLHYFNNQFLVEADFTDEQKYHLDMRRRLNRVLHAFGIAEGLDVAKSSNKSVTVRQGVALDRLGREMIVEADPVVDLSNAAQFPANADGLHHHRLPGTADRSHHGDRGVREHPLHRVAYRPAVTTAPPTDGTVIWLARFTLDGTANVPGNVNDLFDGGVRILVAPKGEKAPFSIDGVSNPGGNVDLVPANAVTISPDDLGNRITIGETHSARTDNPHATTAAQVGALGLGGGTLTGNVQVNAKHRCHRHRRWTRCVKRRHQIGCSCRDSQREPTRHDGGADWSDGHFRRHHRWKLDCRSGWTDGAAGEIPGSVRLKMPSVWTRERTNPCLFPLNRIPTWAGRRKRRYSSGPCRTASRA